MESVQKPSEHVFREGSWETPNGPDLKVDGSRRVVMFKKLHLQTGSFGGIALKIDSLGLKLPGAL